MIVQFGLHQFCETLAFYISLISLFHGNLERELFQFSPPVQGRWGNSPCYFTHPLFPVGTCCLIVGFGEQLSSQHFYCKGCSSWQLLESFQKKHFQQYSILTDIEKGLKKSLLYQIKKKKKKISPQSQGDAKKNNMIRANATNC